MLGMSEAIAVNSGSLSCILMP